VRSRDRNYILPSHQPLVKDPYPIRRPLGMYYIKFHLKLNQGEGTNAPRQVRGAYGRIDEFEYGLDLKRIMP
jgi:hypothetical protein